jgi:hypothetical protein
LWSFWGISSVGRATDLHSVGQRFEPAILHPNIRALLALWSQVCAGRLKVLRVLKIVEEGASNGSASGGRWIDDSEFFAVVL